MRQAIDTAPQRHLRGILDGYPERCCKPASQLLARYLVTVARVPMVQFIRGRRDGTAFCEQGWQSHVWLEAGGLIVDITADQYDEVSRKVFVKETSAWHQTFQTQNSLSYGEMLRMEGKYVGQFERTYRELTKVMHPPPPRKRRRRPQTVAAAQAVSNKKGAGSVTSTGVTATGVTPTAVTSTSGGEPRVVARAATRIAADAGPSSAAGLLTAIRRGFGWDIVGDE